MGVNKALREKVYAKYQGRCAYCGRKIEYKDMQVDHLYPQIFADRSDEDYNKVYSFENLMPSCRMCNHYKRSSSLDTFRLNVSTIPKKLKERNYIYRVGLAYGNVIENEKPIEFYFEKVRSR